MIYAVLMWICAAMVIGCDVVAGASLIASIRAGRARDQEWREHHEQPVL
jgi:hypothetical protein